MSTYNVPDNLLCIGNKAVNCTDRICATLAYILVRVVGKKKLILK